MVLSGYTLLIDVITQLIRKPAASFTLLDTLDVFTLLSFYYHNYLYTSVYSKKRFFFYLLWMKWKKIGDLVQHWLRKIWTSRWVKMAEIPRAPPELQLTSLQPPSACLTGDLEDSPITDGGGGCRRGGRSGERVRARGARQHMRGLLRLFVSVQRWKTILLSLLIYWCLSSHKGKLAELYLEICRELWEPVFQAPKCLSGLTDNASEISAGDKMYGAPCTANSCHWDCSGELSLRSISDFR